MESEIIEIVNKQGKVIRKARRSTAYKKGLLHKAVNIVIFNSKGELFIQQRSSKKSSFPLFWDISAAEHVKPKENFKEAAMRGLMEELSIDAKVKKIRPKHIQKSEFSKGGIEIIENELVELYATIYNGKIKIDPSEVKNGKFVLLTKLKSLIAKEEVKITPWGLDEIDFIINSWTIIYKDIFPYPHASRREI